jgi:Kef-type K+ transport system membrane component KefB
MHRVCAGRNDGRALVNRGDLVSLVVILAASAAAVLLADRLRRFLIPVVVLEILIGVAIGPHLLGLASTNAVVRALAQLGVWLLFFVGGHEVALRDLRGWPLRAGLAGWVLSVTLALLAAAGMSQLGLESDRLVVALALMTTALGVLVPILRDAGQLRSSLGRATTAAAVCGWLGPLLVLTLIQSPDPWPQTLARSAGFLGIVYALAWLVRRVRPRGRIRLLEKTLVTSGQAAVRGAVLVPFLLVLSALLCRVSPLLGAFCAGLLVRHVESGGEARTLRLRLDAVGFGLLIPLFFVSVGMSLDVSAFHDVRGLAYVCAFLGLFVLVRGATAALLLGHLGIRRSTAVALCSSTKLPLLAVIVAWAQTSGRMTPSVAAALVGAALVSVAAFPMIAARLWLPRPASAKAAYARERSVADEEPLERLQAGFRREPPEPDTEVVGRRFGEL